MKKISDSIGANMISQSIAAWVRRLVWTAMILGCAWASAQSYVGAPASYDAASAGYEALVASYAGAAAHYHVAAMGVSAAAQGEGAQNVDSSKDELFNGTEVFAKNATHVTEITMDPDSLGMVGGPDGHKAHNMVLNVVRTYEYDKPGLYNMADVDAFRSKLNTGDWHCSVHERDLKTGESTDVCSKHRTDGLREQAIVTVEPRELTFIHRIWRGDGPGSSEVGLFPMIHGVGPMTMMAMMNPEAYVNMEMGMHGMMLNVEPNVMLKLDGLKALKVQPFNEKQMKDLNEQMKELKVVPDMQVMPDMPVVPTLQTPQVAPTPPAPVIPQSASPALAPQPPVVPDASEAPVAPNASEAPAAPAAATAPAAPEVPPAPQPI